MANKELLKKYPIWPIFQKLGEFLIWSFLCTPFVQGSPGKSINYHEVNYWVTTVFWNFLNLTFFIGRYKVAFDYDGPEEPCSGRYGDYNCMYDAVYDFKMKKLFKGSSVIKGQ